MKMSLRWFGPEYDPITLEQIRQIPGVKGVITTLHGEKAGDLWPREKITRLKGLIESAGLQVYGIESVNVSDDIKAGCGDRDRHIENYIRTLENLSNEGIHLVCYNFMSVFDWTRSNLAWQLPDGSTVLSYDQEIIDSINPKDMFAQIDGGCHGYLMPGWEPERLSMVKELFEMYRDVDGEQLFRNLKYFLESIMPTCEKYGVKMAVHIDDPAWSVFGLPRIMKNKDDLLRLINGVKSEYNGITLCTGSLGSNPDNDIPDIIRSLKGRIHFAHLRNIRHISPGRFEESAHLSENGSLDMFEIVRAFYDIGFEGPVRPDHGRAVWGEESMPAYGIYDRAMGAQYLLGLIEAVRKQGLNDIRRAGV